MPLFGRQVRYSTWVSRVNWVCTRQLFAKVDELPAVDLFEFYSAGLSPWEAFAELAAGAWADEIASFNQTMEAYN